MGGYNPNPVDPSQPATTAAEAEARAGQAVGYRGTYGGDNGRVSQNYQILRQIEQQNLLEMEQTNGGPGFQHTSAYNQAHGLIGPGVLLPAPVEGVINRRNRSNAPGNLVQFSKYELENRAGFTDPDTLGDITTQRLLNQRSTANMTSDQRMALLGTILEGQRQAAYGTATLTDDRFYENELSKWAQNYSERSAAQHFFLKDTGQVGTNPYEYAGDKAVEFLKGSPGKRSEWFSPVSGEMSRSLPGGVGLQEYSWDRAVAYDRGMPAPGAVSYMNAVLDLGASSGSLFNPSTDRTQIKSLTDSFYGQKSGASDSSTLPAPFISSYRVTEKPKGELGLFNGTAVRVPYLSDFIAMFQSPIVFDIRPTDKMSEVPVSDFMSGRAAYTRTFIGDDGKKSDTWTRPVGDPIISTNPDGSTISTQNFETTTLSKTAMVRDYDIKASEGLSRIDMLNQDISDNLIKPFTPSAAQVTKSGFGFFRVRQGNTADFEKNAPITTGLIKSVSGAYDLAREKPVDLAVELGASYAGGWVFGKAMNVARWSVAKSAMSGLPVLSQAGRAASTPIAADLFKLTHLGIGGAIVGGSVLNIANQPTAEKRGAAALQTAIAFGGFARGMGRVTPIEPVNDYAGRTYFTGERKYTPLQSLAMDTRAYITSFEVEPGLRGAYRSTPKAFREIRNIQPRPGITETTPAKPFKEPDISMAQTIGTKRAAAVREAIAEQPHSILGSVGMENQRTGLPTGELIRGFPKIHDVDVRVESQPQLIKSLAARGETIAGIDAKPFEDQYPMIAGRTGATSDEGVTRIGFLSKIMGEAIPNEQGLKLPRSDEVLIGGKDYTGVLNNEKMNVQFARKAQAFMQDLVPAEGKAGNADARQLNEQFRTPKDYYDLQSIGRDLIAGNQAAALQAGGTVKIGTETRATRIFSEMDKTRIDFDFVPFEDNAIIGAKAGVRFKKSMTLGEIKATYESEILAARRSGIVPNGLTQQTAPRPYNPGFSRSVSSAANSVVLSSGGSLFGMSGINSMISSRLSSSGVLKSSPSVSSQKSSSGSFSSKSFSRVSISPSPASMRTPRSPISIPSVIPKYSPGQSPRSNPSQSPSPGRSPSFGSSTSPFTSPSLTPSPRSNPSPSYSPGSSPGSTPSSVPGGFPYWPGGGGGGFGYPGRRVSSPWSRRNLTGAELFMTKKKGKKSPF